MTDDTAPSTPALLEQALERSPSATAIVDGRGTVRWANRALRRLLRLDTVVGRSFESLVHPDERDLEPWPSGAGEERIARSGRRRLVRGDGSSVWVTLSVTTIDEATGTLVVTVEDLSRLVGTEERLQVVLDALHDGVMIFDGQARVTWANPGAARLLGTPEAELIGSTHADPRLGLLDEDGRPLAVADQPVHRALRSGSPAVAVVGVRADGHDTRWLSVTVQSIDRGGGERFAVATFTDVTDRRRTEQALEASEERFRRLVSHAPDPVLVVDAAGRIRECNRRTEEVFGWRPEELVGEPVELLVPDRFRGDHPRHRAGFVTAPVSRPMGQGGELWGLRRDGTEFPIEVSLSSMDTPGGPVVIAIARDLTVRHRAEQAVQADRAKSEFLSRMSHELRTPLNAVLGFAQLLELGRLAADQREAVDHILGAGRHLLGLLDDVLDLQRIEAGRIDLVLEPVSVVPALREVAEMVHPLGAERDVSVEVDPGTRSGLHVLADPRRLRQVLLNLVTNGIKYNRRGGRVELAAAAVPSGVALHVRDTGRGVDPADLDRLFVPFERLDAARGDEPGAGIGLALSKSLVEAMGGHVSVRARRDVGTTFSVVLPLASGVASVTRSQPRRPADEVDATDDPVDDPVDEGACRLLYIEDSDANLRLMQRLVSWRPGTELLTARRGADGVVLARACRPDAVLLDLNLPDLPGEDVLRDLLADDRTATIPVIVLSADATPNRIRHLTEAGALEYLTKPVDVHTLFGALDRALAVGR